MGEYYKDLKLGTCETLYYVRRDELEKELKNTLDRESRDSLEYYLDPKYTWIYRFPKSNEDNQTINHADNREYNDYIKITVPTDKIEIPHKEFTQVTIKKNDSEITCNLPCCPLSPKVSEYKIRPINFSYRADIYIVGDRYRENQPDGYTLFQCCLCDELFAMNEEEIEILKEIMKNKYPIEADRLKPYKHCNDE